jgi:hypothetical protein
MQSYAVYDCKYTWADMLPSGEDLVDALDEEVTSGDAALTLVEPHIAAAALEQWLEDAALDLDEDELAEARSRANETLEILRGMGEGTYVAL